MASWRRRRWGGCREWRRGRCRLVWRGPLRRGRWRESGHRPWRERWARSRWQEWRGRSRRREWCDRSRWGKWWARSRWWEWWSQRSPRSCPTSQCPSRQWRWRTSRWVKLRHFLLCILRGPEQSDLAVTSLPPTEPSAVPEPGRETRASSTPRGGGSATGPCLRPSALLNKADYGRPANSADSLLPNDWGPLRSPLHSQAANSLSQDNLQLRSSPPTTTYPAST